MLSRTHCQGGDLVEQREVADPGPLVLERGMREEPEGAEPVVEGHQHDAAPDQLGAVVERPGCPAPKTKPPPWSHTMTGSAVSVVRVAGRCTLSVRQSSLLRPPA